MNRRNLLTALTCAVVWPRHALAQQSKIARLGLLEPASATGFAPWRQALLAGLRELGYVEGKNILLEHRWAEGKYERLPGLAAELVQMKVDVILAASGPGIKAAQQATTAIPIVMVRTADPVGAGFVASLSRPGRNITGLSNIHVDVSTKYLELLRAAVPKLTRVAVLMNPAHPNHAGFLKPIQATAKAHNITIVPVQAGTASEIEAALGTVMQERAGALIALADPFFFAQAPRIADLAAQHRMPTMFWSREPVEAGALMSYGQNNAEHYYRAATYIDKILKGSRPGELPVEQPTKFELVINRKTAGALGVAIPASLLVSADKVFE